MARKPASRSTAPAPSTTTPFTLHLTNTATFSAQSPSLNVPYPLSAAASVAGGTAPVVDSPPGARAESVMRKRSQPKSKNHGRFPCSIPGCFAVANHLSSMCRHKWGHLPQRLLPACRGHLPSGAPCPVRYQGRADTMKRHWLTHHTVEGPWVPDRYPPFEDLWRLVQDGEIVLSPPSKYAYDSPDPEPIHSTVSGTPRPSTGGNTPQATSSARRNSVGLGNRLQGFTRMADVSIRDEIAGRSRSHSYSGRSTRQQQQMSDPRGTRDIRFSKGNTKPWRISEPAQSVLEDEDDELDDLGTVEDGDMDVEMGDATSDVSASPSRHSHPSLRHSPAYPHSVRSQRSPRSPASVHSFPADHEPVEIDIHVPYATIPPITSLSPAPTEPIITRYPLHPTANYPVLQSSNFREHTITYSSSYLRHHGHTKSKDTVVLGLLALSSQEFHSGENRNPNGPAHSFKVKQQTSTTVAGEYVYGHGKGTPPSSAFTPASIPPSELSLLSHPPTDRILPSSPHHPLGELQQTMQQTDATSDSPYPPMRVSPDFDRRPLSRTSYETWHTHGQTLIRPFTVASH